MEDFQWKNKKKGERHYRCKECFREINRRWYRANKERKLQAGQEFKKKSRKFVYQYLKENHCTDCGESDPACLDFDHQEDKKFNISSCYLYSISTIKEEILKCIVRCSNCHRKKTAREQGWYENYRV